MSQTNAVAPHYSSSTEWATVKDNKLYIGSFGKEYVNQDGTIKNRWNLWVSVIDAHGGVAHEDWTERYEVGWVCSRVLRLFLVAFGGVGMERH